MGEKVGALAGPHSTKPDPIFFDQGDPGNEFLTEIDGYD